MTLSVLVRLREGRYDAAGLRPTEPEWPPHPARLFCGLVASARTDTDWAALRWLEAAGPPEVWASAGARAESRRGYVVTNRTAAAGGSQHWPGRTNGVRTRTAAVPDDSAFAVVWPEAEPDAEVRDALVRIARRVPYLGRTTSTATVLVGAEPATRRPEWTRYVPSESAADAGGRPLRVPTVGYVDRLRAAYDDGQRAWEVPAAVVGYVDADRPPARPVAAAEPLYEMVIFGFARGVSRPPGAWLTTVTATLRQAAIARIGVDVPPEVSGHGADGRPHVAYLGLPDVGHEHAHGGLLGVALAIPTDLPASSYSRVWDAVVEDPLRVLTVRRDHPLPVTYDPFRGSPWGLTAGRWTAADTGGARRWVSATPMMLDRFPGRKNGDRGVLEEIAASFVRAGFPVPDTVEFSPAGLIPGAIHRPRPGTLPEGRPGRPMMHVRVGFAEPLVGPLLAGSLRYLGLGLFVPDRDERAASASRPERAPA